MSDAANSAFSPASAIRDNVQAMKAYTPGAQINDAIKLNTNECAWGPTPAVHSAVHALVDNTYRLYPDPSSLALRELAASTFSVQPENILVGNGSDDCLTILYRSVLSANAHIACPWPTYGLYDTLAAIQNNPIHHIAYERDSTDGIGSQGTWHLPTQELIAEQAALTLIANPNNPSGTRDSVADILEVVKNSSGLVVVDEAYVDFVSDVDDSHSLIPYINTYANLIVLRTFSKSYSLAGARVGLLFGQAPLVEQFSKVKDSYNVNAVSQCAAYAALADRTYHSELISRTLEARTQLEEALSEFGWSWPASQANFLLCHVGKEAPQLLQQLRERGLLVRWWNQPELHDKLRITVGKPEHQSLLIQALREFITNS